MTPSLPLTAAEPDVTIVVPVYRNAATLPALAQRIRQAMGDAGWTFRLLLVVDASPDDSWSVVRQLAAADPRVGGLLLAHNVGQHAAVLAGLRSACASWFVVMDADLQDAPEAIPALLAAAREHSVTVFARRCGRYERWDRLITSRVFKTVLRWIVERAGGRRHVLRGDAGSCRGDVPVPGAMAAGRRARAPLFARVLHCERHACHPADRCLRVLFPGPRPGRREGHQLRGGLPAPAASAHEASGAPAAAHRRADQPVNHATRSWGASARRGARDRDHWPGLCLPACG